MNCRHFFQITSLEDSVELKKLPIPTEVGDSFVFSYHDDHLSFSPPLQISAYLDLSVIGQLHAKRVLSVAAYNHYKRSQHNKNLSKSIGLVTNGKD